MTYEERKARFMTAIKAEANKQSEQINRDTDYFVETELVKAEAELRRENEADIRSRMSKLRRSIGITVSEEQRSADAELYSCREKIEAGVFAAVEERLKAFRNGDGYCAYLLSGAAKLNDIFADCAELTLYYAPGDEKYLAAIRQSVKPKVNAVESPLIKLGGFRAESLPDRLAVDCTIDSALAGQRLAFRATPELCIGG